MNTTLNENEILTNGKITHLWIRMHPVHNGAYLFHPEKMDRDEFKTNKLPYSDVGNHFRWLCNENIAYENISFDQYLKSYIAYEDERHGSYKKKRQKRYGLFFDVQMPGKCSKWAEEIKGNVFKGNNALKTFVKELARQLTDREAGLYWCAWTFFLPSYEKNEHRHLYVRIWISDREVYGQKYQEKGIKEYYKSTRYIDKTTGRFCRADDSNAVMLYKKGQVKKVINSNDAICFKKVKTNRFKYRKGSEAWMELRMWLLSCYEIALKKIGKTFHAALLFQRRKKKFFFTKYVKRCVTAENKMQRYMEEVLNPLYTATLSENQFFDSLEREELHHLNLNKAEGWKEYALMTRTKETQMIEDFKDSFAEILDKRKFTDESGKKHRLSGRCDVVEQEFAELKHYFDRQVSELKMKMLAEEAVQTI